MQMCGPPQYLRLKERAESIRRLHLQPDFWCPGDRTFGVRSFFSKKWLDLVLVALDVPRRSVRRGDVGDRRKTALDSTRQVCR